MSARNWVIVLGLLLAAMTYAGSYFSAKSSQKAALGCAVQESAQACAQRQCTIALAVRGLLPSPVPSIQWDAPRETWRRSDLVLVKEYTGEYRTPGGQSRYVQCEMVGKTPMSARGLLAKPLTK